MNGSSQQSNYHFSHTVTTDALPDAIWQIWTDVPNWHTWDRGLKSATLDGAFMIGAKGKIKPDKGPRSKFVITEIREGQSYTFKTRVPLGWLIIKRTLEVRDGITSFTHDVAFTGILKKVLGNKLGKKYRSMLPEVMNQIKQQAENH